jgi:hypothetical protein
MLDFEDVQLRHRRRTAPSATWRCVSTMEEVTWKPGQSFTNTDVLGHVNEASTGFDPLCLGQQVAAATDRGSDVWTWSTYPTVGALGTEYNSGDSWYQKFGGKHSPRCFSAATAQVRTTSVPAPHHQRPWG